MLHDAKPKIEAPKVSIITAVYNGARTIENCILSVQKQTYSSLEHIIIDGGSTDGTLGIIERYRKHISYWVSEPDGGIGDAMNKGIREAKGEYILFIHSDDRLADKFSLEKAMSLIHESIDIAMFSIIYGVNKRKLYPNKYDPMINFKLPSSHQGMICKRSLFEKYGEFDTSYRICMDYEILLRWVRQNVSIMKSNFILAYMGDQGISSKVDKLEQEKRFSEERRAHFEHSPSIFTDLFYYLYWFAYPLYRNVKYLFTKFREKH